MKSMIPDWLPKLFVKAEGSVREATTKKFSDFQKITDTDGMEVVGLKGGANVRADILPATTSMIATEPDEVLRNSKGQYMATKDLPELANQKEVNRFLWENIEGVIEGGERLTDAPSDGKYYARKDADWAYISFDTKTQNRRLSNVMSARLATDQVLPEYSNEPAFVLGNPVEGFVAPEDPETGEMANYVFLHQYSQISFNDLEQTMIQLEVGDHINFSNVGTANQSLIMTITGGGVTKVGDRFEGVFDYEINGHDWGDVGNTLRLKEGLQFTFWATKAGATEGGGGDGSVNLDGYIKETDDPVNFAGDIYAATGEFSGAVIANGGNSGQWNSAYGWGNHASAGYAKASDIPENSEIPDWDYEFSPNTLVLRDGAGNLKGKKVVGQTLQMTTGGTTDITPRPNDTIFYSSTSNQLYKNSKEGMRDALDVFSKEQVEHLVTFPGEDAGKGIDYRYELVAINNNVVGRPGQMHVNDYRPEEVDAIFLADIDADTNPSPSYSQTGHFVELRHEGKVAQYRVYNGQGYGYMQVEYISGDLPAFEEGVTYQVNVFTKLESYWDGTNLSVRGGYIKADKFIGDGSSLTGLTSRSQMAEAFTRLQRAVSDETTFDGLREALVNGLGGLIESFEYKEEQ